ncbi:DUF429 domain-containing protein [Halarsenatibacter silvermanii]|nr:DUF429 domain-containing protein [Halarsenatibacter silvermanii]
MKYLGVDGCPGGWLAAGEKDSGEIELDLYKDFVTLWQENSSPELLLIDIPIGLKKSGSTERLCDRAARSFLSKRSSSVFPVPFRPALKAESWQQANRTNKEVSGRGLSRQSWGLADKIKEIDDFLGRFPGAVELMHESHPELVFWALNGCQEMAANKKSQEGFAERKRVLARFFDRLSSLIDNAQEDLEFDAFGQDDIVDALALLAAARRGEKKLISLPDEKMRDDRGLKMEIVYPQPVPDVISASDS